jgi:hypothetical protein
MLPDTNIPSAKDVIGMTRKPSMAIVVKVKYYLSIIFLLEIKNLSPKPSARAK